MTKLTITSQQQLRDLEAEFEAARLALQAAEAALAQEAAAVNAFRMHCRLRLDKLVDGVLAAYATKQNLIAQLRLQTAEVPLAEESHPLGSDDPEHIPHLEGETAEELVPYLLPRDKAAEKQLYRELVKKFHPDLAEGAMTKAYATTMMVAINNAYEAGDGQRLYDLAGELNPQELVALRQIEAREVRQWREKVLKCQRRQRKVTQQLFALRQENIARLWRKAQTTGTEGENWWDEIACELAETRARLEGEVAQLQEAITQMTNDK